MYFSEIKNKNASTNDILRLFKYENCTYLTESVFLLMADNLNKLSSAIENEFKEITLSSEAIAS